jgi:MINDY deubiquitinase
LCALYSVLPRTQSGLDVNVRFGSIDGFRPGRESAGGELALFRLAGVPLVHGWLADVEDEATWEAVVAKAGDYDAAVAMVAEGDSLASGMVVGSDSAIEEQVEKCARRMRLLDVCGAHTELQGRRWQTQMDRGNGNPSARW